MRTTIFKLLVTCLTTSTLLVSVTRADEDWGIRRSPFDARIVGRYKALLNRRPNDGYALNKLVSLYKKQRGLAALVKEYRALARSKPKSFAFQVILGHLYRRMGKRDQAVKHYERARTLNPKTPTVPAALGALYRKLGRTQEATDAYKRALSLARSPRLKKRYLRALASIALTARDLAGARKYYDKLVALEPKNIFLRIELAQALAKSGHEKEAITQYRTILARTSDSATKADVLKAIGGLQAQTGEKMKAVATYRKAMALTARGHWLRRELTDRIIEIYREKEDLKSLIAHYESNWRRKGHFEHEVLARLYDETGDEVRALKAYRAALKAGPHAVDTRVRLIKLLERTGRSKEVIKEYRILARRAPGEPKYQLELAKRLYRSGKQKEAFAVLDQCGRRFPQDASVHSALADLYARWGEQRRAMHSAQTLVRIEPRDPSHLINLGEQHYLAGQKRRAIETWRRLLRVIPKRHAAYAKLAEIYGQHDMTREAIELFRKAIRLKPKHLAYHRSYALLLERKQRTSQALRAWDKVLKLAKAAKRLSGQREARTHVIDILHRTYQLRTKIRIFRMDFNNPTPSIDAGFLLAEGYLKLQQHENAAQVYRRLLELEPESLEAMTALEAVYRRQRKLAEAVKLLKQLAKRQPKMAREYYQRIADLQLQLYNDKEALIYAHKAVTLGSGDARSYQRLGELYEKKEDYVGAMKAYAKAIQLAPNRYQVHFALARLHTQRGHYRKADKLYRQIILTAKTPETLRKAFRLGVDLAGYLGNLSQLEKEILPLSVISANADVYRQLLVKIYRRRIPILIHQARQGSPTTRRAAEKELSRIGVRGLAPLLEELATSPTSKIELVRILGYLSNPNAVLPLLRIAAREPAEEVITVYGSSSSGSYYGHYRYRSPFGYRRSKLAAQVNQRVLATVAVGRIADERAVDGLTRLLHNQEGTIREASAWALSRIPGKKSSRALFEALGDPKPTVQMMACAGLGVVGGQRIHQVLEEVMLDKDRQELVRAACAWGLGVLGKRQSVDSLVTALRSGEHDLQRNAAWALGVLGDQRAVGPLVRSLWSKRLDVRQAVIWALVQLSGAKGGLKPTRTPDVVVKEGKIDADEFITRLTAEAQSLKGRELAQRLTAVVLTQRDAIVEGLEAALLRHRDVVLRVLTDLDADPKQLALGPLTEHSDLKPAQRAKLDRAIRAICHKVQPQLARLVTHRDRLIRERAISVYTKLAPADVRRRIGQALKDPSWRVRVRALKAVVTALERRALTANDAITLVKPRLTAKHWRERETAATVAGKVHHADVGPALARTARDFNGFVRQAAVAALGSVGGAAAVPALLRALDDEVSFVRAEACRSLARLKVSQARAPLLKLTKDPSPRVRRAAQAALRRLP